MKQYKKISSIALLASLFITSSYASYSVLYPLRDIKFTNIPKIEETWSVSEPVMSQWIYGQKECSNWIPSESTKAIGVSYQQTANNCSVEKTRSVQNTEISNLGNHRNAGELTTETEIEKNLTDTRVAYGSRFTHILQVAHYFGWGTTHYYGYFAPIGSYTSFERYDPVSLSPSTINGQQIEYLTYQNGGTIFRTVNGVGLSTLVNYEITVNGTTCPFQYNDTSIPVENRILVAQCAFFNTLSNQTVKVDISPKQ